jgi:hypothetical protein
LKIIGLYLCLDAHYNPFCSFHAPKIFGILSNSRHGQTVVRRDDRTDFGLLGGWFSPLGRFLASGEMGWHFQLIGIQMGRFSTEQKARPFLTRIFLKPRGAANGALTKRISIYIKISHETDCIVVSSFCAVHVIPRLS